MGCNSRLEQLDNPSRLIKLLKTPKYRSAVFHSRRRVVAAAVWSARHDIVACLKAFARRSVETITQLTVLARESVGTTADVVVPSLDTCT